MALVIDPRLREVFIPELTETEELLWAGRPTRFALTPKFYGSLIGLIFFLLFFGWAFILINHLVPWLFFALFVCKFLYGMLEVNFQYYAITDKRIIIVNRVLGGMTISLEGGRHWWIDKVNIQNSTKNDLGTIYLIDFCPINWEKWKSPAPVVKLPSIFMQKNWFTMCMQGLFYIENVSEVEKLIPFPTLPWDG